jgi:pimeloyl-ACP methyl ester carboxylesterase
MLQVGRLEVSSQRPEKVPPRAVGVATGVDMTFIVKSVDIPDRIVVPYVEQGDPSGVPMLLLHGFTDSWHSFERVLPHLSQTVHAFALTQRGHGDADRPGTTKRDIGSNATSSTKNNNTLSARQS